MLAVIGLGYVGVTSLLCFKSLGVDVIGFDNSQHVIDRLTSGNLNIADAKLQEFLKTQNNNIKFSANAKDLEDVEEALVCVPTNGSNGALDLTNVMAVLDLLKATKVKTVWIRSTIDDPSLFDVLSDYSFNIYSYPEFLREGKCWDDFFDPPLIVLGKSNQELTIVEDALERNFSLVNVTSPKEALTVKLFCNAFHALKVSFANEMTNVNWISEIDINRVMEVFCTDKKLNISEYYLKPGLPFGGPCLPKDTTALANSLYLERDASLLQAVLDQNERHKIIYADKVCALTKGKIGFYGYEFKVGTGDIRNSPILDIAKLASERRTIYICDEPHPDTRYSAYEVKDTDKIIPTRSLTELKTICDIIITDHEIDYPNTLSWNSI
ncbi:nucleotide sugar dehydrogenase [Planktomarina sp.]|nr:nucleotide sugar dehydrogenase [Planktomarina sp.]